MDALRLPINEDLVPVRDAGVDTLRCAAGAMELRLPVSQSLLKIPLEVRPDRVVLVGDSPVGRGW